MFSSFSVSAQKTKPTTVKFHDENNTTVVSFKKVKDFVLLGRWEKINETVNQMKFYLKDNNSNKIGIGKLLQKKAPFYKKNMETMAFINTYIAMIEVSFSNEKTEYDFMVLEETPNVDFKYYTVNSIESESNFHYRTINLIGVKNGIVYDLSAFINEGKEAEMKSLLMQLYNSN